MGKRQREHASYFVVAVINTDYTDVIHYIFPDDIMVGDMYLKDIFCAINNQILSLDDLTGMGDDDDAHGLFVAVCMFPNMSSPEDFVSRSIMECDYDTSEDSDAVGMHPVFNYKTIDDVKKIELTKVDKLDLFRGQWPISDCVYLFTAYICMPE